MGTGTDSGDTAEIKCPVCRQAYSPQCDYRQGRCPRHKPLIGEDIVSDKTFKICMYVIGITALAVVVYCFFNG